MVRTTRILKDCRFFLVDAKDSVTKVCVKIRYSDVIVSNTVKIVTAPCLVTAVYRGKSL